MLNKELVSVAWPSGFYQVNVTIQIDTTVESSSISYKIAYYHCVYFMRRELHIFDILSVLTCVWPLGPYRVVWPYLHILLLFLQLAPRANEWCSVHRLSCC